MNKNILCILIALIFFSQEGRAADYYWVGGSGDWSDLLHWATASGGNTYHIQAPTAEDNVIFDQNSFSASRQVVSINSENVFCRNMDWRRVTNRPKFVSSVQNGVIHIHGSMWLAPIMEFLPGGSLRIAVPEGRVAELNTAGNPILCRLVFDANGRILLSAELKVENHVWIKGGEIVFAGQKVDVQYLKVEPTGPTSLDWDKAEIHLRGEDYSGPGRIYACSLHPVGLRSFRTDATFVFHGRSSSFYIDEKGDASKCKLGTLNFVHADGSGVFKNTSGQRVGVDTLFFAGNARILGDNTIGQLVVKEGKHLLLPAGKSQTVDQLEARGSCQLSIHIQSDQTGAFALLESSRVIVTDYCILRDVHGRGSFTANNSTNLGNADGWTINGRRSQRLYWVGGAGEWFDPVHWSFSSGGPGGACIPTGIDDVTFDGNSFSAPDQVVTISKGDAQCHNMDWDGVQFTPTLSGSALRSMSVFGSLRFVRNMHHTFPGDYLFLAKDQGQQIESSGQVFNGSIYFDGKGGWKLMDAMEVRYSLYMNAGELHTNDQNIIINHFFSESKAARRVVLGSTEMVLRQPLSGGSTLKVNLRATDLSWEAGTSSIVFDNGIGIVNTEGEGPIHFHDVRFKKTGYIQTGSQVDMGTHQLIFDEHGNITGSQQMDSVFLSAGYRYRFKVDNDYTVGQIVAKGNCDQGLVYIETDLPGRNANFILSGDMRGSERLFIEDIHASGGTIFCSSSIDGGNTKGWSFNSFPGRRLYWVGGQGDWNERQHWSLTSGGTGGECLPTPIDDVIFDSKSGFQPGDRVRTSPEQYIHTCRDLVVAEVQNTPWFLFDRIVCYGSLHMKDRLRGSSFLKIVEFKGKASDLTLDVKTPIVNELYFRGDGLWTLQSDIRLRYLLLMHNGSFNAGGHSITVPYFHVKKANKSLGGVVDLTGSFLFLTGKDNGFHYTLHMNDYDVRAKGASIRISSERATVRLDRDSSFAPGQMLFENPLGLVSLQVFNTKTSIQKAYFFGSGEIHGSLEFDSLLFSAGKAYWLQDGGQQKINRYLSILGNNCFPIRLSSLRPGVPSALQMDGGTILADFIQMKDQEAVGGLSFFAGVHSTNIDNSNTNWIFDTPADKNGLGILGEDIRLCQGKKILLSGSGFNNLYQYHWNTGDTTKAILVEREGHYWVDVSFEPGCQIRDSIQVSMVIPPKVELGRDTSICEGDSLFLDVHSPLDSVQYRWSDTLEAPSRYIKASGLYHIVLDRHGCTAEDSIFIGVDTLPDAHLGEDRDVCVGQRVFLYTRGSGENTRWNTGESTDTIVISQPGTYSVQLFNDRCSSNDTVVVRYHKPDVPPLRDTSLCEQEDVTLGYPTIDPAYAYRWNTGEVSASIPIDHSGIYTATVVDSFGCEVRDSFSVELLPLPTAQFVTDTSICMGESFWLEMNTDATSMKWLDNGMEGLLRRFDKGGIYPFELVKEGCLYVDTFRIAVVEKPELHFSGDTVLCTGEETEVFANYDIGVFHWQDQSSDNPRFINQPGTYWGVVSNEGCETRSRIEIRLDPCSKLSVYIPNAFTPNSDGANDTFLPQFPEDSAIRQFSMSIWNRWGEVVFVTSDPLRGWEGKIQNKGALPGVYIWTMEAQLADKKGDIHTIREQGTVTLIR